MNTYTKVVTALIFFMTVSMTSMPLQSAEGSNPAFWKVTVEGDFNTILNELKGQLQVDQFQIIGEEDLAKGLENNKQALGKDRWNTIGFKEATTIRFCSLIFNHEVFNLNMDWSILCPFKVALYSMKSSPQQVTIMTIRPSYLLKHDPHPQAPAIGKKIEQRIISSIEASVM